VRPSTCFAVAAALALVGLGLANLALTGTPELAVRQAMIAGGGLLALTAFWRVRVRLLGIVGWVAYGASVALLAGVLVAGVSANGATRWIGIGSFSFQPSELAKLGLLLVLAGVLGSSLPEWERFVAATLLALVPIALTVAQPDLSTTTLLAVLAGAMLIIGRVPARFLLPLAAAAAVSAPLAIGLLRPYQVERLGSFLVGAHESPTGSGWAVGRRRSPWGRGRCSGGPTTLALPARTVRPRAGDRPGAREPGRTVGTGRRGRAVLPRSSWCGGSRCRRTYARTPHGALVGGGLAILLGVETVVSVGGNLGLLPLAGVPFPLLSYGGTALVVHLAAIGVVLAVRRDGGRRPLWALPRLRNPRPRLVRATAVALSASLVLFGVHGWQLQSTGGAALQLAGQEQMTRCVRLPAPRGAITDRHGAVLAANAVDTGERVRSHRRRPRAAAGSSRGRRPPRRARRWPERRPARAARARGGHDAGAPRGRRPAQHR
jgi:cell division protein FtsW (lipid II flippase)